MKPELAGKDACSSCGACIAKCPKQCIHFHQDESDNVYPTVDTEQCIECGTCVSVSPSINPILKRKPIQADAEWRQI